MRLLTFVSLACLGLSAVAQSSTVDTFIASEGDAVLVPPGAIHTWWNADPAPARYLIAMPRVLDNLIVALHARSYEPDELMALFEAHNTTYIGWTR